MATAKPRSSVKFSTLRLENPVGAKEWLVLPYTFSTQSMGFTIGAGGGTKGYGQDQLVVGGTVWRSADDAVGGIFGMWDLRLPHADRLFLSIDGSLGYYPRQRAYTFSSFTADEVRPGGNDSDKDDYVQFGGQDNWFDVSLEYVLPIGAARHSSLINYRLKDGMLTSTPSGGQRWNPMTSGITTLLIRQYNHYLSYETDLEIVDRSVHPAELALYYNNTDFPNNPSMGSSQYLSVSHDFGWLGSHQTWTFVEFEASKYYSLGATQKARQRVIAVNFWTGDAPQWEEDQNVAGRIQVSHGPPHFEGARLGGIYRMRAYPTNRFNGRSVVYSTIEYRYTPEWNPLGNLKLLRFLKIDWWQFVGFIEGGRVADAYDVPELMRDWKADAGLAVRAFMAGSVVRFDLAFSEEGASAWIMLGHPF